MAGALVGLGWDGAASKSDFFLLMVSLVCETSLTSCLRGLAVFKCSSIPCSCLRSKMDCMDDLVRNMDMNSL